MGGNFLRPGKLGGSNYSDFGGGGFNFSGCYFQGWRCIFLLLLLNLRDILVNLKISECLAKKKWHHWCD